MIKMSGIVFFKTKILEKIVEFYINEIEMSIWLEQKDCTIIKHGNLLLGFCQRDTPDIEGMITFFYPTREEVDKMYEKFKRGMEDAIRKAAVGRYYTPRQTSPGRIEETL